MLEILIPGDTITRVLLNYLTLKCDKRRLEGTLRTGTQNWRTLRETSLGIPFQKIL